MKDSAQAAVDGEEARLVDLSTVGAQLVVSGGCRPKRAVTVTLGSARKPVTAPGTIVWARVELSRRGPVSRIGVEFIDPDQRAIETFLMAHRQR
jgi:hypothetical protein